MTCIPQDDAARKAAPMFRGLLGYFPWALFKVAAHSFRSDRKHNPDKPESEAPHWRREASTDHPDCIVRHLCDAYGPRPADFPGDDLDWEEYHLTALAWRANALLQEFGEAKRGAAPGCRSVFPSTVDKVRAKLAAAAEDRKLYPEHLHPAQKLAIDAFRREETPVFPPKNCFAAPKGPGRGTDEER